MCNQQVTDVMNFAEYIPNPLNTSHTLRQEILTELVRICEVFGINRSLWNVEKIAPNGGFTLASTVSDHFIAVSFGKNKITFDGDSIDWVEFDTSEHDSDYFAALITMILFKYQTKIAYTTPVEALQAL